MLEQWVWDDVPLGFRRITWNHGGLMLVREGLDAHLIATKILLPTEMEKELSPFHGRSMLRRICLESDDDVLVRAYYHGGIPRRVTGEFFFTWPARPFRELTVTEQIRKRGIPTLDVLAALVKRSWGPFYRGWLVTRELRGAEDLWMALHNDVYVGAGTSLLQAVGRSVRQMHLQGLYHADLNLRNILVRQENGRIGTYVIDFDKARLYPREVPLGHAKRNLNRLLRSVRKLDPKRQYLSEEDWVIFLDSYYREA